VKSSTGIRGHPLRIIAESPQGERAIPYSAGADAQQFVVVNVKAGNRVKVEFQVSNKHIVGDIPAQLEWEAPPTEREELKAEKQELAERHEPRDERRPGEYSREWVVGQLRLRLEKVGLAVPSGGRNIRFHMGRAVDAETGEILDTQPTPQEMLTVVVAAVDPLAAMAMELGGVLAA
jgi:hypothetical protein